MLLHINSEIVKKLVDITEVGSTLDQTILNLIEEYEEEKDYRFR